VQSGSKWQQPCVAIADTFESDFRYRRDFYGLAYFKLAVILEGIHYRYTHGQTVGVGFDTVDTVGTVVEPLIEAGLTSLKESN
jgi:hypothetical protein